ncbi:hypothetical protein ABH931_007452 [Streptacidiphilus sp. MAP12-33]|uniref:hypothetical protein n=1 Tax=Streptacidiphilus sp. MAP12-33 TaxID=3156266 RepID=UPI0035176309
MRIRSLTTALGAAALATTLAAGTASASAATAPTTPTLHAQVGTIITQSGKAHLNPALNPLLSPASAQVTPMNPTDAVGAWCNVNLEAPFQVTSGGAVYGQSKYTGCSTPGPQACRLVVDLMRGNPLTGGANVGHGDSGWKSCSGYVNAPMNCAFSVVKQPFYTIVSLEVEYLGRYGTNVGQSSVANLNCH